MLQLTGVGQTVLEARRRVRLKQENVGAAVGATGSYINLVEKNRTLPSFEMAVKLEQTLNLTRGLLLSRIAEIKIQKATEKIIHRAKFFGITLAFSHRFIHLEPNGHARSQKNIAQV